MTEWYEEFGAPTKNPEAYKAWVAHKRKQESFSRIREGLEAKKMTKNVDWHRLDPKDTSAVLQEQGESIFAAQPPLYLEQIQASKLHPDIKAGMEQKLRTMPAKGIYCTPQLMKLRDDLKREISDEHMANKTYAALAATARTLNLQIFGSAVQSISEDELRHSGILQTIVDVITRKCK